MIPPFSTFTALLFAFRSRLIPQASASDEPRSAVLQPGAVVSHVADINLTAEFVTDTKASRSERFDALLTQTLVGVTREI